MTALDYILEGLEAELALERELGIRSIEIDRSLLAVAAAVAVPSGASSSGEARPADISNASSAPRPSGYSRPASPSSQSSPASLSSPAASSSPSGPRYDFVFLHHKPLSPAGVEMMAKIVTAMGKTADTAPVIIAPPLPLAKIYVVLGGLALRKWFPGQNGAPNQWIKTDEGQEILVSNSPEYILRFKTVTPAVKKIKQDMWTAIKGILKRI